MYRRLALEIPAPAARVLDPAFEGGRETVTEVRGRFVASDLDDVVGVYPTRRAAQRALDARRPASAAAAARRRERIAQLATGMVAALALAGASTAGALLFHW